MMSPDLVCSSMVHTHQLEGLDPSSGPPPVGCAGLFSIVFVPPVGDQHRLLRQQLDSFECTYKVIISLHLSVVMTQVRRFIPFPYQLT